MQLIDKNPETQTPISLNISDVRLQVTPEQFDRLCELNPDLRLELTQDGELIAMAPAGYESSEKNSELNADLVIWNRQVETGRVFDSSGGFTMPNGAIKSPDATWIEKSKLANVPAGVKFPQVIPDLVIELRSATDRLSEVRKKMEEYRSVGVQLGWLINPQKKQVEIYRLGKETEILEDPTSLSGEDVLPGFVLDLRIIF